MRKRRDFPSSGSGSGSTSGANNKTRTKKENDVDMISNLPDPILHHIFSFLDIKQAIQTCILSRRWRYFWVSLPTLKFSYFQGRKNIIRNEFMDFVERVLMFRGNSNIHDFTLVTNANIELTDRLNTWILVCIIHNVQQLTLNALFTEKFQLHHCLFTCKSLTKLVVGSYGNRVSLGLPYSITLPSLKTLSFRSVKFKDEDSTNQFFSGCPMLEWLNLNWCDFPHINVNISSPLLQHMRLSDCKSRSNALDLGPVLETNFQLCAPNLISFDWNNNMSIHCAPKNLSSLVKADISTHVYEDANLSKEKKAMYAPFMVNILRGIHNVEHLTLSAAFLEVITGAPDLLDSQPTKFCNLRCLKLKGIWLSQGCIPAISYLLKISPNIETLLILDVDRAGNAATDLLDVQPTYFCNLRCLKMRTLFSIDWIYAIACLLKICPNTETLSYTLYHKKDCDEIMNPYCDKINSDQVIERDYWEAGLSLEGLLNHVKCFELCNVTGRINELEFIEILLKNAMQLEKLVIGFDSFETTYSYTNRRQIKFSEKVLTFPRASTSVVILFE